MLIYNALICNESELYEGYIVTEGERIKSVERGEIPSAVLAALPSSQAIDAAGALVIPGVIDSHVHFREPGLTDKATIATESRAAAAGGVTSYMEMPNTRPPAVTLGLLEEKYALAADHSAVNYSFYLGATNDNLGEIERLDHTRICGLKLFMGSSTGNMLVDRNEALAAIFERSPALIAAHCEDEDTIRHNLEQAIAEWGDAIPASEHPKIRSREACFRSTAQAVALAHKHGGRLHVLHISTADELPLFDKGNDRITAEACLPHLWFSDADYAAKGNLVKINPAIKTSADREALREAVRSGIVTTVGTDHAPHLLSEKQNPYLSSPSGAPSVQHLLPAMLTLFAGDPALVAERLCHAPARLFGVKERGFLRPGYYADIAIVQTGTDTAVTREELLYKCGWSPFEGARMAASVTHTLVNGAVVYTKGGGVCDNIRGQRLVFGA